MSGLDLGAELRSPFAHVPDPPGETEAPGRSGDAPADAWLEQDWATDDEAGEDWVHLPDELDELDGRWSAQETEGPAQGQPRDHGAPFASDPPAEAFFPVRSTDPRGAEVSYASEDGRGVGNASRRFGARRGTRRHAAVDLHARRDDEVVACEDGRIVAFFGFCCGTTKTSWALLVDHGHVVINYGEVDPRSLDRLGLHTGDSVRAGQIIAYIGVNPRGSSMLHFETYAPGTKRSLRWPAASAAPSGLLDPTRYLLALAPRLSPGGAAPALATPGAESPALRPVLRRGSRGEPVRRLQRALTAAGFAADVDGDFGRLTLAAVRAFQASRALVVDGIVGSNTWRALDAAAAGSGGSAGSAPSSASAASSGPSTTAGGTPSATSLAVLRADARGRTPFRYHFTPDDLVWSAKLLVHEAGGRDDVENRAVLWAMFNRYALFTHTVYSSFTDFIRAYSTTLQPVLRSSRAAARHAHKGDAVYWKAGGNYPGTTIPRGQLVRHRKIQAAPWEEVKASARDLATRALCGELPNPGIGLASEFASTWVFYVQRHKRQPTRAEWETYTRELAQRRSLVWVPLPEVEPRRNVFFVSQRVSSLPHNSVAVVPATSQGELEEDEAHTGSDALEDEDDWVARLDEGEEPVVRPDDADVPLPAADLLSADVGPLLETIDGPGFELEEPGTSTCVASAEPDPAGAGPHPLLKRWGGSAHSSRPAVGFAQQHLNEWLARHAAGTASCVSTAGAGAYVDARLAELRGMGQLPLDVDCRFAAASEAATRAFQACHGLARDGRIGPLTWPPLLAYAPSSGRPTPPSGPSASAGLSALEARYLPPAGGTDVAPISRRATVRPIIDGLDYFAQIQAQAAALVTGDAWFVTGWWFTPGFTFRSGKTIQDLLLDAVSAGVDVRVILWANRQVLDNPGLAGALGAGPYARVVTQNVRGAETLRTASRGGGAPLADRVLIDWSGNGASSHHMKLNYFSHQGTDLAFVGGIDYVQNRLDAPEHRPPSSFWHDAGVRVDGDAARRVMETFDFRWREASTLSPATYDIGAGPRRYNPTVAPIVPPPTGPAAPASTDTAIQVVRSVPDSKEFGLLRNEPWATLPATGIHEVRKTFQSVLAGAQRYVYVEDQMFDATSSMFPALVDCCRRGVKVIAVLPGRGDPLDMPGTVARVLSPAVVSGIVDKLTAAEKGNFAVWHLDGIVVHSKLLLVDDAVMSIGSANFMDRSMEFTAQGDDSECSVVAVTTGALAGDLRVRLWSEHLRVSGATQQAELRDLSRSLGFWRPGWGSGLTFAHPESRLVFVGPTPVPAPLTPVPAGTGSSSGG